MAGLGWSDAAAAAATGRRRFFLPGRIWRSRVVVLARAGEIAAGWRKEEEEEEEELLVVAEEGSFTT